MATRIVGRYRMRHCFLVLAWVGLTVTGRPLHGQLAALEKILGKVEDVSLYASYGGFAPSSADLTTGSSAASSRQTGMYGFGVELSLGLFTVPGDTVRTAERAAKCKGRLHPRTRDTVEVVETTTEGGSVSHQVKYTPVAVEVCREKKDKLSGQLALGYTQLQGFRGRSSAFDVRGSLRELPSVALYLAFAPSNKVSPYVGIRGGLLQLANFRAYAADGTLYSASGSLFQAGLLGGLVADTFWRQLELFTELSYNFRKFPSVEWSPVSNVVPAGLPRSLNFSGWLVSLGLEFSLENGE